MVSPRHVILAYFLLAMVVLSSIQLYTTLAQTHILWQEPLVRYLPIVTKTSSEKEKDNTNKVPVPRQEKYNGFKVDILSVASNTRPHYVGTQHQTWASHPLIRNFFQVTEDDDVEDACIYGTLDKNAIIKAVPGYCKHRYLAPAGNSTWFMNRLIHHYASPQWLKKKDNPAGWLCAQKRFPLGLAKITRGYADRKEELPDFLLVVDDDTYYNIDVYYDNIVLPRRSDDPYVAAGCLIQKGGGRLVFPFGGFGLTLSNGTLKLLLRPIDRSRKPRDDWEKHVYQQIDQSLILEKPTFRNGMSVVDLMDAFAREEPFVNVSKWSRGYCFHGYFFLSFFIIHYRLGGPGFDTILDSIITPRNEFKGLCNNEYQNCKPTSLVCHYQTPQDMKRLVMSLSVSKTLSTMATSVPVNVPEHEPHEPR